MARLQQLPQVQDLPDGPLLLVGLVDHALAKREVSVGEVGEGLQQDLRRHCGLEEGGVELVQLQHSQVGLQIVGILLSLRLHIALQRCQVLRVIPVDSPQQFASLYRINFLEIDLFSSSGYVLMDMTNSA